MTGATPGQLRKAMRLAGVRCEQATKTTKFPLTDQQAFRVLQKLRQLQGLYHELKDPAT